MRWADEDVRYIQACSHRYPGALDISLEWAHEALADPHLVEVTPYPRSRLKASAFIGWSSGAQHYSCSSAIATCPANYADERLARLWAGPCHLPGRNHQ